MDVSELRTSQTQYRVGDFLLWNREGQLKLNPHFQRRSIWSSDAKSYLIDTMLLGFPIPKVYLRDTVDPKTQVVVRDVVDGQQRLRAILEFADNQFPLNKRSELYRGKRYRDLETELQHAFLSYAIGVEQLINADDSLVLETFSRLNSYTLPLNTAEKRHAKYQSELKWFVHALSNDLRDFLVRYRIVTTQAMLRMGDDEFYAGLVNIILNGVGDGGADALNRMYANADEDFPEADQVGEKVRNGVLWMDENLAPVLEASPLAKSYQVQMIFAAYVHQRYGLPPGQIERMPARTGIDSIDRVIDRLGILAQALEADPDEEDIPFGAFVRASSRATTRFSSRGVRFLAFSDAITRR